MRVQLPTLAAVMAAVIFFKLPSVHAVPSDPVEKRQAEPLPFTVNVGLRTEIDEYNWWVAWENGVDPCDSNSGSFTPQDSNPCGIRFQVPEWDQQLTMNGCGGDDLWLTENGITRVATCYWAPGDNPCSTADPFYKGQWQCTPDW